MKKPVSISFVALALMGPTVHIKAQVITYSFQSLPAGALPGGFLSLTVDGVNAYFGANGTAVDVNLITGTHVLHTGNYHGQMGVEFSKPVSQIMVGIDDSIPTANNSVRAFSYYGPGYNLYPMSTISSSGSTLIFDVPNNIPEVFGILLDGNSGSGFALDYVSIQVVPEPAVTMLFVLGTMTLIALGVGRRFIGNKVQQGTVSISGRRYPVPTADHAGLNPGASRVVVWFDDDSSVTVAGLHVVAPEKGLPLGSGNGEQVG